MSVTITVLQPDPTVPLERFSDWLKESGAELKTVNLWEQPVPAREEVGDGVIVLGGRDDCLNGYAWMPQLHILLRQLTEHGTPILGICLGHQILADAFGGTVELGLEGEEGAFRIALTSAGTSDPIFRDLPADFMAAESHHDVVTALPPDAVLLASSERYPHQAFRLGCALGMQFHPEASPELMGRWAEGDGNDPTPLVAEMRAHDDAIATAGKAVAHAFAHECATFQPSQTPVATSI
ncbi:type 1 glutamine amidotransferase [Corynebacterium urogenitale]